MNPWDPICATTQESKRGLYSHYKVQGQPLGSLPPAFSFLFFLVLANFVTVATKSFWQLSFLGVNVAQNM
jgi:hypothetical protein